MSRLAIGDLVEYQQTRHSHKPRVGTIGIVSDGDGYSDPEVTIIFPVWEMDDQGETICPWPGVWKKIGRADLP